jgi:large subunit ribosomal protein L35
MPKLKTRSSVKKRFSVTSSGRVKHKKGYKGHLLGHKSRKRKRNLRKMSYADAAYEKRMKSMLQM